MYMQYTVHEIRDYPYNQACSDFLESGWFLADHVFALGGFVPNALSPEKVRPGWFLSGCIMYMFI